MRFEFHRILTGAALAWLVSSCTVVSAPPPQSPNNPPPPPPGEPVVAGSASGEAYVEADVHGPESAPAANGPASAPSDPALDHSEPIARRDDQPSSSPVKRRDHRRGQPTPVPDAVPDTGADDGHTRVPIRRGRDRLGKVAEFQIEPTAGPIGTTVTIYGDFRRAVRAGGLTVSFTGTRRAVNPIYVTTDRIAVVVPKGARTGAVQVALRQQEMWRGNFAVTRQDRDIFVPIDEGNGLLGAVYKLPENTKQLPDFQSMGRPFATIVVPNLQVAPRRFDTGFPGLDATGESLLEWFGIRFMGLINVPTSGQYAFRINSDDGARLYIDNQLVIDNDGQHAPQAREGSINLSAGKHDIVVEYFQGPRYQIALELAWRRGGGWSTVPADAFSRYTGYDCSSEPEILCCQGNSPECRQCKRNADSTMREWQQMCRGGNDRPGTGNPSTGNPGGPDNVDCSRTPDRLCCQGNSARCRQCRQQAAAERASWQQQCGNTPPTSGNPGNVDCSRAPERMCCQGNSATCRQCRQQAAAERAAWQQQCVTTLPVDDVNCGKAPPRRACCKALTPRCRECQQQAQAEQQRWEQQCQAQ